MSAFIHDDGTFDVLYATLKNSEEFKLECDKTALEFVRALREWNYKSVNFRYNENDVADLYVPKSVMPISDVALIKLIESIDYQCCEVKDWIQSDEYRILRHLSNFLALDVVTKLPEYSAAAWEYHREHLDEVYSISDLIKGVA